MKISVKKQILNENDLIARKNRKFFDSCGTTAFNIMASPGAGKTSFILAVRTFLPKTKRIGVMEGDVASRIDTDRILSYGIPAVQINTGGNCHLDALMVKKALSQLSIRRLDILFIENVGNLICPANVNLGTHDNIVIASVPEGDDKPYKYPGMFKTADLVVLNKIDLIEVFKFNLEYFTHGIRMVNPNVKLLAASCTGKRGIREVSDWIVNQSL